MCWPSTDAQRRLRDLRRRDHVVLDLHDRALGVDDPEVRDGVHAHRHVVLRDHLLRRHVQRDRAQVDLDHLVDDRDEQEEARALRRRLEPAEPEDDAALVLAGDLDRRGEQEDQDDDELLRRRSGCGHGVILCAARPCHGGLGGARTTSVSPSSIDSHLDRLADVDRAVLRRAPSRARRG